MGQSHRPMLPIGLKLPDRAQKGRCPSCRLNWRSTCTIVGEQQPTRGDHCGDKILVTGAQTNDATRLGRGKDRPSLSRTSLAAALRQRTTYAWARCCIHGDASGVAARRVGSSSTRDPQSRPRGEELPAYPGGTGDGRNAHRVHEASDGARVRFPRAYPDHAQLGVDVLGPRQFRAPRSS